MHKGVYEAVGKYIVSKSVHTHCDAVWIEIILLGNSRSCQWEKDSQRSIVYWRWPSIVQPEGKSEVLKISNWRVDLGSSLIVKKLN